MYTFSQSDLHKLDPQIDCVSAWQTQWESYCSLSGLEEEDIQKQLKALMLCFSIETITIVQNLGANEKHDCNHQGNAEICRWEC